MPKTLDQVTWPRHTERLSLRPATLADAAALWAWQRLPEVTEWLPAAPPDEAEFTRRYAERFHHTLIVEQDGRVVAQAKLESQDAWSQAEVEDGARNQQIEIGWSVDPRVQGRGFATEMAQELLRIAFDELGVHRVVAYCFADNVASRRVMDKIGLRHEATFIRDALHRSGRWVNGAGYAMLAEEWGAR